MPAVILVFTGCAADPPVEVLAGLPPSLGPIDLVVAEQVLATLDPSTGALVSHQDPILLALTYAPAEELAFPLGDGDGCWAWPDDVRPADTGLKEILVEIAGSTLALGPYETGVYLLVTDGTQADAAATVGAELRVAGGSTGVHVPTALRLSDTDQAWRDLLDQGRFELRWEPGSGSDFVSLDLDTDSGGIQCALEDDGEAVVDLGTVPQEVHSLFVGRRQAATATTPYGEALVFADQDLAFQP